VTKEGDQVTLAAGFDAQHAEAVLFVVKGDALDEAGQDLRRTDGRCVRHPGMMEIKILWRYRDQAGTARRATLATGQRARSAWRGSAQQNQRHLGTLSRAGATLGAGNCRPTIREAWGFGAWCVTVNI
jgi:hypothetical protein